MIGLEVELVKILISACLLGEQVRYNGGHKQMNHHCMDVWWRADVLVPICPEMAGGLPTPREPAEIVSGSGLEVIFGQASVKTKSGGHVSDAFLKGAHAALDLAKRHGITMAILKEKSPSCGSLLHYDGTFTGMTTKGEGVTCALLRKNNVVVFSEDQLANAWLYWRNSLLAL